MDNAFERARAAYGTGAYDDATLEFLFPQLKESEDERIRECIGMALTDVDEQRFKDFGVTLKDCLAYLKKQKEPRDYRKLYKGVSQSEWFKENYEGKSLGEEQKPEGCSEDEKMWRKLMDHLDWHSNNRLTHEECDELRAWLEKQKENPKSAISIPADCASNAKCPYKIHGDEEFIGDIRDTPAYHFGFDDGVRSEMEKQKEQKPHLELKAGKWYICHRAFCARADHLTVKEGERFQCEKDGIVKGFVIKEPEKYFKECSAPEPMEKEQKPVENPFDANETMKMKDRIDEGFTKMMMQEQKPAEWDELQSEFKNINEAFEDGKKEVVAHPERYGLCKPAEWSEEDEKMNEEIRQYLKQDRAEFPGRSARLNRMIGWLISLRPQLKYEWSEEDEVNLGDIKCALYDYYGEERAEELYNMLKSLRPSWKPSEEQMKALIDCVIGDEYDVHALVRLWAELKKL